jgi:phospholipase C
VVVHIPATGTIDPASVITASSIQSLSAQIAAGTSTPITNVIVVIGENQTFDGLFGGYQPLKGSGQTVNNLLSEGIINADGTPGPNFAKAAQTQGNIQTSYSINPSRASSYSALPQPFLTGILEPNLSYAPNAPDPRFPTTPPMPNGPFQITKYVPYATATSATGDPVHRFFQMWQQTGGDNSQHDMFVWPAVNVGQGGATTGITAANPGQGGELMGFVNMSTGDAQYFNGLAQQFAISDNYHQWIMGGTGMNFFAFSTGDLPYFNYNGQTVAPPLNQIENPNPTAGTADFFLNDGYEGGSYVNCSDPTQPGVSAILNYLQTKGSPSNCDSGKYYLVNNYSPAYDMNGVPQPIGPNNYNYPAQTVPTIAEALSAKGVSWKWYTGARNPADVAADAQQFSVPVPVAQAAQYNNLGDPLMASSNIVKSATFLKDGSGGATVGKYGQLRGLTDFGADVAAGTLPAVSFVVPKNLDSGHPGYSIVAKYEGFIYQLVSQVTANPTLWKHTAIIVTTDEGGGHFDSGYIQNLDFFGDGPRIPLMVISPYSRPGAVDHVYNDHSSVLKFIERNWRLPTLSARSRDNLPNPVTTSANPYQPANQRAIGDLSTLFAF